MTGETGLCTDLVIRALRDTHNGDLQQLIHEDIVNNFDLYPNLCDLKKADSNIDHRRVPNILKYYERMGKTLPIIENSKDHLPGDIVTWDFL